jgi:hypothetical protein
VTSVFCVNLVDFNGKNIFCILVVSLIFLFGLSLDLGIPWSHFCTPPVTFYFQLLLDGRSQLASLTSVDRCARSDLGFLFFALVFLTSSRSATLPSARFSYPTRTCSTDSVFGSCVPWSSRH